MCVLERAFGQLEHKPSRDGRVGAQAFEAGEARDGEIGLTFLAQGSGRFRQFANLWCHGALIPYSHLRFSRRDFFACAVARDCDGAPARHLIEPLPGRALTFDTLKNWFRRFVEVRDEEGAERVIVTAAQTGATPQQMTELLLSAATDHRYIQIGHTADFANKAIEAWQQVGALDSHDDVPLHSAILASLTPSFVNAISPSISP